MEAGHPSLGLGIDATSVDTGNAARDKHLRSRDFFDTEQHPWIHFASTDIVDQGRGWLHVIGVLDVAGKPVPLGLDVTTLGRRRARDRGQRARRPARFRHVERPALEYPPPYDTACKGTTGA